MINAFNIRIKTTKLTLKEYANNIIYRLKVDVQTPETHADLDLFNYLTSACMQNWIPPLNKFKLALVIFMKVHVFLLQLSNICRPSIYIF